MQQLERDVLPRGAVQRAVHDAHATPARFGHYLEAFIDDCSDPLQPCDLTSAPGHMRAEKTQHGRSGGGRNMGKWG